MEKDFYFEGLGSNVQRFDIHRLEEDSNLHCSYAYVGDELKGKNNQQEDL